MAGRGGYLKEPRRTAGNLSEKSAPGGGAGKLGRGHEAVSVRGRHGA
jgi:hypothetical protein